MKGIKRLISMFLCCVIVTALFSGMTLTSEASSTGTGYYSNGYYDQYNRIGSDKGPFYWAQSKYTFDTTSLKKSGCGIFSLCNAVKALNGRRMDALAVALWARKANQNGGIIYQNSVWRYRMFQKYNTNPYNNVNVTWGKRFNFEAGEWVDLDSGTTLKNTSNDKVKRLNSHLNGDGTAIIHVSNPGHFMCLTKYENGYYTVIESAESDNRGLKGGNGVYVKSAKDLSEDKSGSHIKVDGYVLIKKKNYNQLWYNYKNVASGKLLNVQGSSYSTASVTVYNQDYTLGQDFVKEQVSGSEKVLIKPACGPSCNLRVQGVTATDGAKVKSIKQPSSPVYDNMDYWFFEKYGNYYIIRSASNKQLVLTARGSEVVVAYMLNNKPSNYQLWDLRSY